MFYLDEQEKSEVSFDDVAGALAISSAFSIEKLNAWGPVTSAEVYTRWEADDMGTMLGSNLLALQQNHWDEPTRYITLVHLPTGQRIRITLPYEEKEELND